MADWDTLYINVDFATIAGNGNPYVAIEDGILGIAVERTRGGRP